jgi:DNA-binding Xre family transcriptional regulator
MDESRITAADLARAVGATTASVSDWVNGITKELKSSNCDKICMALGINHHWLITGKGPMRPSDAKGVASPNVGYSVLVSRPRLMGILNQLDQDYLDRLEQLTELYLAARQQGKPQ